MSVDGQEGFFSLWDVDSGNCLGTYDSHEEALGVIRLLVEEYGPEYAEMLDLSRVDEAGHRSHVGAGAKLMSELAPSNHLLANRQ